MKFKRITFTVTNDLTYDQRMHRICRSLSQAGYKVTLVGRVLPGSKPLQAEAFKQTRLRTFFHAGIGMYFIFNLRLFVLLLFHRTDLICAIDLDTILPCYFSSALRNKTRIYDAHELFTEQKEIVTRPLIYKVWLAIERFAVPKFKNGYTVNNFIKAELNKRYQVEYEVVRNLPVLTHLPDKLKSDRFIIYQGSVNKGRSFETLIPAMLHVNAKLVICGNGNYFTEVERMIKLYGLESKVELRGYVKPAELTDLTSNAYIGITLFENTGLNQYQSLANRFFDYMMGGVPQVCVGYPEYKFINDIYSIAYLITDTEPSTVAKAINLLLDDKTLYGSLQQNCLKSRLDLNWGKEEIKLKKFYDKL